MNKLLNLKHTILLILLTQVMNSNGQPCNQQSLLNKQRNKIPSGVCIRSGHIIDEILDSVDVNGDGKFEFLVTWHLSQLRDGDTIYVSIFNKSSNGTYTNLKTFNNLFPINFKSYSLSYKVADQRFTEIHNAYNGMYPFRDLQFENSSISIKIMSAVNEGYILVYEFRPDRNNWYLKRKEKWAEVDDRTVTELQSLVKSETIDQFSYLDYMY
jgi:hypothetical protein